jgi:hypothetical protein
MRLFIAIAIGLILVLALACARDSKPTGAAAPAFEGAKKTKWTGVTSGYEGVSP